MSKGSLYELSSTFCVAPSINLKRSFPVFSLILTIISIALVVAMAVYAAYAYAKPYYESWQKAFSFSTKSNPQAWMNPRPSYA